MRHCPYCDEEIRDNAVKCKHCGSILTGQNAGTLDKRILMPGKQISQQYDTLDAAVTQGRNATILARQYRIVKKIGEGGMGVVYLAEDIELGNRKVAIKVLPPLLSRNIRAVENLRKEALTAIKLNHPNIIRLHGFHSDSEIRFLVMEYIDGQTLEEKVIYSERGRMTFEDILPIAQQIAAALDYAHNQKPPVFHRDLKPSNIMIDKGGKVKLLDFGIAREMKDSYTRVTGQETSGTVPYMCPQQINGEPPNAAMDIYSFAVTLYECMAAHTPFYTGDIKHQILSKRPPEIVDIPGHVNKALQIALAKQASDRPGTAKELIRLLEKPQTTIDKVDEMLPEAQVPPITPDSKVVVEKIRTWIENRKAEWNEVEWKDFVISLYNNGHSVGLSRSKLERIRDSEKIAWFEAEEARKRGRQTQRIKRVGFFIFIILITVCIGIFALTRKNTVIRNELPQQNNLKNQDLLKKNTPPTKTKLSNIVVAVNGIDKSEDELQRIMKPQLEKMAKHIEGLSPESAEQYKSKLRQAAMEYLIAEVLLDEKVKEANIVISDEEVMSQIKESLSTQKPQLSLEEFKRKAAEAGRDFNEIKQQIEKRITYQKLLNTQWAGKINITEEDAKKFYDENPTQFEIKEQVRASHILIKPKTDETGADSNQEKAKAKEKIEGLLKQIKEGADFAVVAKTNSDCPSAKNGGDLNFFSKGQMVPSFENAAFELEIGQVSDIVETRYGYHIVKVTDYKAPGIKTFEQSKDYIIKDLTTKKQSELYKQYIESLKKKANIIYPSVSYQFKQGGIIVNSIGMKLVYIPAGEFMMGSPSSEEGWISDEGPQHQVRISKGFYMGQTEVTQSQWKSVMGTNPSEFKGDSLPVECVSWIDAVEFCNKLNQKEGKTYRLPTEAEWEYACRAGTSTPFNTGSTISTSQANYNGNYTYGSGQKGVYSKKTVEVGSFAPNSFGLYDMHGNVWEWCSDWYDEKYYSSGPNTDPTGPSRGSSRVLRGGSWIGHPRNLRSANRSWHTPGLLSNDDGIRVVLEVEK